jgi:hypothetical protein
VLGVVVTVRVEKPPTGALADAVKVKVDGVAVRP